MSGCPKCNGELVDHRCASCLGFWIHQDTLRDFLHGYLLAEGFAETLVALHEVPAGPSELGCPECAGAAMAAVKFRNVKVERCPSCSRIFLDAGEAELLVKRVLVSARHPKGRQPLSRIPKLQEILSNPNRFGNPMWPGRPDR